MADKNTTETDKTTDAETSAEHVVPVEAPARSEVNSLESIESSDSLESVPDEAVKPEVQHSAFHPTPVEMPAPHLNVDLEDAKTEEAPVLQEALEVQEVPETPQFGLPSELKEDSSVEQVEQIIAEPAVETEKFNPAEAQYVEQHVETPQPAEIEPSQETTQEEALAESPTEHVEEQTLAEEMVETIETPVAPQSDEALQRAQALAESEQHPSKIMLQKLIENGMPLDEAFNITEGALNFPEEHMKAGV